MFNVYCLPRLISHSHHHCNSFAKPTVSCQRIDMCHSSRIVMEMPNLVDNTRHKGNRRDVGAWISPWIANCWVYVRQEGMVNRWITITLGQRCWITDSPPYNPRITKLPLEQRYQAFPIRIPGQTSSHTLDISYMPRNNCIITLIRSEVELKPMMNRASNK